jgi:hypothetical protein
MLRRRFITADRSSKIARQFVLASLTRRASGPKRENVVVALKRLAQEWEYEIS